MSKSDRSKTIDYNRIEIAALVRNVANLHRTALNNALGPLSITGAQFVILSGLSASDETAPTITDLGRALDLGPVAIIGSLNRMELKGFITRDRDPHDKRIKRLSITESGRLLLAQSTKIVSWLENQMMIGLPAQSVEVLRQTLYQVRQLSRSGRYI